MNGVLVIVVILVLWITPALMERSKTTARRAQLEAARRERDSERWRREQARERAALDRWLRGQP